MDDIDLQEAAARLSQIECALDRLEEGTYGQCASCGSTLDDDVLAADPVSTLCDRCASAVPTTAATEVPASE